MTLAEEVKDTHEARKHAGAILECIKYVIEDENIYHNLRTSYCELRQRALELGETAPWITLPENLTEAQKRLKESI